MATIIKQESYLKTIYTYKLQRKKNIIKCQQAFRVDTIMIYFCITHTNKLVII